MDLTSIISDLESLLSDIEYGGIARNDAETQLRRSIDELNEAQTEAENED